MQDRFRFRCYHKIYKKIYDVYSITPFGVIISSLAVSNKKTNFEECILMQCTGLKDKNGKLIYEGDILRINNKEIQPVEYMECYAQFHIERHGVVESFFANTYEVIGNIYENPELLTEEVQA